MKNTKYSKTLYTYDVEDGQFSFQIELDELLGNVGETIHISPNGIDELYDVIINSIEGYIVSCSGPIQDPI